MSPNELHQTWLEAVHGRPPRGDALLHLLAWMRDYVEHCESSHVLEREYRRAVSELEEAERELAELRGRP